MPFHNTYHFVPASGRVSRAGQETRVETINSEDITNGTSGHPARHDRWVPDTYSGRIICRLALERPTLVGGNQRPPMDDNPHAPRFVEPYCTTWRDHQGQEHSWPGIPGSSLRGMIGAVVEAISQSTLRVLENRPYSVRVNVNEGQALSALGRLVRRTTPAADGSQFDLIPVGLPTLEMNHQGNFALPARWYGIFREFTWDQVLTAYVDGYEPVAAPAGRGVQLRLKPGSFLANERPASYDPSHPRFYYASLSLVPFFSQPVTKAWDANLAVLRVKQSGNRQFLLGRNLAHILNLEQWSREPEPQRSYYRRGYLRVLGIEDRDSEMPQTKKHEIFIPHPEGKPEPRFPVPQHVLATFLALGEERARDTENRHPFSLSSINHWQCQDGDLFYFNVDDNGTINEISLSAVWRRKLGARGQPVMQSAHDFFDALSPGHLLTPLRAQPMDGNPRQGYTPAELLLGVVEDHKGEGVASARALASRVRFFDAISFQPPRMASHAITLKTLASPKPPSPALYFHSQTNPNTYIPKGSLDKDSPARHRPNGRKFYLHHPNNGLTGNNPDNWECRSRAADGRDHLRLSCQPLLPDPNNPFWFHLDFDNLTDAELTLLITALQPSPNHRHKLGLGKSLGLGTVKVEILGLFLVDRQGRYGPQALDQPRYTQGWLPASYQNPPLGRPATPARPLPFPMLNNGQGMEIPVREPGGTRG